MKKNAIMIGLGLLLVLIFVGNAARFYQIGIVDRLSAILYDYRLRLTMPQTIDERIVIVDIDEKSLEEEGRWPWGRDRVGMLVNKLFDRHGVALVGFDVVFAERDTSSGLGVLQHLGEGRLRDDQAYQTALTELRPRLEYDKLLADSFRSRKVVLGYYLTDQSSKRVTGMLPEPVFPAGAFQGRPIRFSAWNGYGANLPELQNAAAAAGHFNPMVDEDGIVRRVPMLAEYNGAYYESLSLAMVRTLLGHPALRAGLATDGNDGYGGLEWLEMDTPSGRLSIPVDERVSALVPYRGSRGSFRYVSAADVLHDRIAPQELKDKIVLVGTSAPGLLDMRATPVAEVYPGVEINANMVAGILDQNLKSRPPWILGAEVFWLLLVGVAMSFLLPGL
ncbi:MAG TPA: CHASE2 domain-containing protein, partial [Terriglobales bacterium]|nr:CHASE2 domain-containing protein [Terriglobales bacterium]